MIRKSQKTIARDDEMKPKMPMWRLIAVGHFLDTLKSIAVGKKWEKLDSWTGAWRVGGSQHPCPAVQNFAWLINIVRGKNGLFLLS